MLESLQLQNFQAYRKFVVDFSPTVTCLVGDNGAGKSTVMRALEWIFTNGPIGDWMVRWGKSKTFARVRIDGRKLTRHRNSKNYYILDGERYDAVRSSVPDEIANLVNIRPINIQSQFDGPFWFSDTAGRVSRELNEIVSLEIIDIALTNAQTAARNARASLDAAETRSQAAQAARSALDWVKGASEAWRGVYEASGRADELLHDTQDLQFLIAEIRVKELAEKMARERAEDAQKLIEIEDQEQSLQDEWNELNSLLDQLTKAEDAASKGPGLAELSASIDTVINLNREREQLQCAIEAVRNLEREECRARKSITTAADTLGKAACPLCGSRKANASPPQ